MGNTKWGWRIAAVIWLLMWSPIYIPAVALWLLPVGYPGAEGLVYLLFLSIYTVPLGFGLLALLGIWHAIRWAVRRWNATRWIDGPPDDMTTTVAIDQSVIIQPGRIKVEVDNSWGDEWN